MKKSNNFSRRKFIGQSLAGVAGIGLVNLYGSPLLGRSPEPNTFGPNFAKVYKIGIIGCGNRSKAIIGSLNSVPDIEITALCDILPHKMAQRAELIKGGPKPRFFTDYQEMLKSGGLDAVAIITPPVYIKTKQLRQWKPASRCFVKSQWH